MGNFTDDTIFVPSRMFRKLLVFDNELHRRSRGVQSTMISYRIKRMEHSIISLLLLVVLLIFENDSSLSAALSPTTAIGRLQEAITREQPTPSFSSASSLFSSTGNDYQASASISSFASSTASDDRRNESLEQVITIEWTTNVICWSESQ